MSNSGKHVGEQGLNMLLLFYEFTKGLVIFIVFNYLFIIVALYENCWWPCHLLHLLLVIFLLMPLLARRIISWINVFQSRGTAWGSLELELFHIIWKIFFHWNDFFYWNNFLLLVFCINKKNLSGLKNFVLMPSVADGDCLGSIWSCSSNFTEVAEYGAGCFVYAL